LYLDQPLHAGETLTLPSATARHVRVLRLQPASPLTLFNGQGGEWGATLKRIGRDEVLVRVGEHAAVDRELSLRVTIALGMPANERMDALVEKATELGVSVIQPLLCERSVLRLRGERAEKRIAHWQAVAVAACEQCGRTRVARIAPVLNFAAWLDTMQIGASESRLLLSLRDAQPLPASTAGAVLCLSGPEGGLTDAEEAAARARGFVPVSLGTRVLRADTAPLALLAQLALTR
jgi:16S rRNA (uracil1498-N3)-methyltransferase